MKPIRLLLLFLCFCPLAAYAQTAEVGGAVQDPSGAVIPKASVEFRNQDTGVRRQATTNGSGVYHIVGVDPGKYDATVQAKGFKTLTRENVTFQVGDKAQIDFKMQVGDAGQTITVDGSGLQINTTDGSVSTVIDRQFVANMPLNGRSFQDLISMTPGIVTATPQTTSGTPGGSGDFSINGQRTESNYYMVDGVAANVSAGPAQAGTVGGRIAATSALGTTQSLLSVDDMQEFRVESSSYSAEYGRSPGGQLSFATRSGTNAFHGSAYDYFRNGWFDANDWFNDHLGQRKEELHQNDFGGTFGGPVWIPRLYKGTDKTFFFTSYEGLRVVQPVAAAIQYVPDAYMRQQAPPALQPLLNAFPQPSSNGIDYGTSQSPSLAQFFQGYSVPGSINSSSIRIDHTFTPAFSAFFRFADTPTSLQSRTLSFLTSGQLNVQTYTLGTTWLASQSLTNQFRLGYSRSFSGSLSTMDSFGGAVPVDLGKALGNSTGTTGQNLQAGLVIVVAGAGVAQIANAVGTATENPWNVTDTVDFTHGAQHWKFGIDFRRVPGVTNQGSLIEGEYTSAQSVLTNTAALGLYQSFLTLKPVFTQLALFAQNDWRVTRRISLSAGLRWELAPPPHNDANPQPYTVTGSLSNPSTLNLAPNGTALWRNSWFNFAPRLGVAWQANTSKDWETVARVGGGVFFDTNSESASGTFRGLGFRALAEVFSVPLPLTQAQQNVSFAVTPPYSNVYAFPSHLQLPYTLGWNASLEQGLGQNNVATISYVGSAGRRLIGFQELSLSKLNPLFSTLFYIRGTTSDYDALQAEFQRSVRSGLTALVSYTWSHSIDEGSNASALPLVRGNSDFDVRNNFQAGLTWDLPHVSRTRFASATLNGWGLDGRLVARTAFPITLNGNFATDPATGNQYYTNVNLVPGQPIYLYGRQYAGGKALNAAAFATPIGADPGNAPRNFARGFGESQVNFAARRDFVLSERVHLQFRAESFNIFNHPNFGYVDPTRTDATFGQATKMLNQSLGTVASQYQQGGPRSMQFALHLAF